MANKIIKLLRADSKEGKDFVSALRGRRLEFSKELVDKVSQIIENVKERGDDALCEYTKQFDYSDFSKDLIRVSKEEIELAFKEIDQSVLNCLKKAKNNIQAFHERQLPKSWFETRDNGSILGQMVRPVDAAGLYVPGGKGGETPLVSSVLMNAIPAKIAGVKRIILCTPPGAEAKVSPYLLVAATISGVNEIYRAGSAWAIAAMAYGTETILPVDVIAGPGNIFVTIAKKLIAGSTGIDMIAGPSEILVIADKEAKAKFIAADMLSQAEHDIMATSILITTSSELADKVAEQLDLQLKELKRSEIAKRSLEENGIILIVSSLNEACKVANVIAPEHLELMVKDPWALMPKLKHAGAIFLGDYTPEPIGDYIAGPNHVLPTMGTARFSSALGVETFLKKSSIISYSKEAFFQDAKDVMALAEIEGLTAHKQSIKIRME